MQLCQHLEQSLVIAGEPAEASCPGVATLNHPIWDVECLAQKMISLYGEALPGHAGDTRHSVEIRIETQILGISRRSITAT